jgi:hypothetical protein
VGVGQQQLGLFSEAAGLLKALLGLERLPSAGFHHSQLLLQFPPASLAAPLKLPGLPAPAELGWVTWVPDEVPKGQEEARKIFFLNNVLRG